jgi:hypothetical protein
MEYPLYLAGILALGIAAQWLAKPALLPAAKTNGAISFDPPGIWSRIEAQGERKCILLTCPDYTKNS